MKIWKAITAILIAFVPLLTFGGSAHAQVVPEAETWAFCGVWSADAGAQAKAYKMASLGIDATFGPCLPPGAGYSPVNPVGRYADPATMLQTVVINAYAGMKTIIFDERFWSTDPAVRSAAITFWQPHVSWIRAIDLGDEYDPNPANGQWGVLVQRWNTVINNVTPTLGVGPYTNHLSPFYTPGFNALDQALADLPGAGLHLSFDDYNQANSQWVASNWSQPQYGVSHLMCAISVTQNVVGAHTNTPTTLTRSNIKTNMGKHRQVGCDSFLIFNAGNAYFTAGFSGLKTLMSHTSPYNVTDWGLGVKDGSTYQFP